MEEMWPVYEQLGAGSFDVKFVAYGNAVVGLVADIAVCCKVLCADYWLHGVWLQHCVPAWGEGVPGQHSPGLHGEVRGGYAEPGVPDQLHGCCFQS